MKNKNYILVKFIALILAVFPAIPFSQVVDRSLENLDLNKQYFFLDPLVFNSRDSLNARLDLYIELPLENIQFKRNVATEKYEAFIDYSIVIKDSKGETLFNNTYSEKMSNSEDEQRKVADNSVYAIKQFFLKPGEYKLNFSLKDKGNQKEYSKDYEIGVKDFNKKRINFSDVMLVSDYKEDNEGKKEISPLINANIGNLKDFYLFFEVYNSTDSTIESSYYYKILDEKNNVLLDGTYYYFLDSGVNKKIEKISTNLFTIGNYTYEITDKNTKEVVASKNITYRWDYLPVSLKNLDLAISQLIYVATSNELDFIKKGKTRSEKERRFLKFWKDKDPSPSTPKNEFMIEYYNRIKIANERYTHFVDGWKTDMGMVFIIFGNPGNIERHPFESDTRPYEIWEYFDVKRRFIFVDDTGMGDYRLITPIWDESTKLRY